MRLCAEISRKALANNLKIIRKHLPANTALMLVVKANAYGHGTEIVVDAARNQVDWFGVTSADEAAAVLDAGGKRILAFFEPESIDETLFLIENNIAFNVFQADTIKMVAEAARKAKKKARVHIKINTGMNRLGAKPEDFKKIYAELSDRSEVEVEGIWTHLATADRPGDEFAQQQIRLFKQLTKDLRRKHLLHAANSGGALFYPEASFDMVRVGIAAYGYLPDPDMVDDFGFGPVLTLKASVLAVHELTSGEGVSYGLRWRADKPTRVGIVSAGYADGITRSLSGRFEVLFKGKRYQAVGTVCMDQFAVDFREADVSPGDEVIIIGKDIPAVELARKANTITYEILSRLGTRIKRIAVE